MTKINPFLLTDAYKISHIFQYPENTSLVYTNFTPRKSRIKDINYTVFFGLQAFIKEYLIKSFNENFFSLDEEAAVNSYKEVVEAMLGKDSLPTYEHVRQLHQLGYLPLRIKALPEGSLVPMKVPALTIVNTKPEFFWLPNFIESLMSAQLWQPCTSATLAFEYKKILTKYANETSDTVDFVNWQGHDFAFRGMSSLESAALSGAGHLTSFTGSDTVPTIPFFTEYYNSKITDLICGSVPATEHSVMCAGTKDDELETFRRLLHIYPKGIISIVSDTWDLWKVLTEYLPVLKDKIVNREGKVVIRPDCYSEDTLFLTNYGWKSINAIKQGALVAQVEEDGSYTFVQPSKIVDEFYEGEIYKYTDFYGKMDLLVTPNHRMVYKQFDKWKVDYAENCKPNNYTKQFIRSAKALNKSRKLSFIERLNIAFQADGSYQTGVTSSIRFSFSKIRKIQRLENLLKENNIEYSTYSLSDGKIEFNIKINKSKLSKDFNWVNIDDLCSNWCQEFIEELSHWDSCIRNEGRIKFDTTNKAIISTVELIALSAGYGCLVSEYEDERSSLFSKVYTANILLDNKLSGQSIQVEKTNYKGNIVCVTVPTGKIVVKRNRCTMVCGNSGDPVDIICGKDSHFREIKYADKYLETKDVMEFWDYLQELSQENVQHGERGPDEYTGHFKIQDKYFKATVHNLSYNRYDKQYYFLDMWEPPKIIVEEIEISPEQKGVVELLYDIFGGTKNSKGYIELPSYIGAIYGDSITPERATAICERLKAKGFASTNIVLGIGSYTYQYNTRDTFGWAMKATYVEVKEFLSLSDHEIGNPGWQCVGREIFKDPITDDGTKKSARGLLRVDWDKETNKYILKDQCTWEEEKGGCLETIFEDGKILKETTLQEVRNRLASQL